MNRADGALNTVACGQRVTVLPILTILLQLPGTSWAGQCPEVSHPWR